MIDDGNMKLTQEEAAIYLDEPTQKLIQWRKDKKGPLYYYDRLYYKKADLDEWVRRNGRK